MPSFNYNQASSNADGDIWANLYGPGKTYMLNGDGVSKGYPTDTGHALSLGGILVFFSLGGGAWYKLMWGSTQGWVQI